MLSDKITQFKNKLFQFLYKNNTDSNKQDEIISLALCFQFVILTFKVLIDYFVTNPTIVPYIKVFFICLAAIPFLYALPIVLQRKKRLFFISFAVALVFVAIQFLVFPLNRSFLKNEIFNVFLVCLPSFIYALSISNYKIFVDVLKKCSFVIFSICLVQFVIYCSRGFSGYNMSFGYYMLIPALVSLLTFKESKYKIVNIVMLIMSIIAIVMFGSRGPLIPIALFTFMTIVDLIFLIKNKKLKYTLFFGLIIIIALTIAFFQEIVSLGISVLDALGIQSRTLRLFLNDLCDVSGRDFLFNKATDSIKQNWLVGTGIASDRWITNSTYVHNIFLELLIDFGVVFGGLLIAYLLYLVIRACLKNKNNIMFIICLLCLGLIPLMLSGSYLNYVWFWIFVPIMYNFSRQKHDTLIETRKCKKTWLNNKIITDLILNIISTAIPIFVIQIIILPLVNNAVPNQYGMIVTYISLFTLISQPIGSAINNVKLLKHKEYAEIKEKGDFNRYWIYSLILDTILMLGGYFIISKSISVVGLVMIVMVSILNSSRNYLGAFFRIELNYVNILISNLILTAGYFLGFGLFKLTGYWEFIYLIGNLLSLIFIFVKTKPYREGLLKSKFFKANLISILVLLVASFLGTLTTYVDKLILYPMLGDAVVAMYFASTIFGKIIAQFISPINSVILSYLAKQSNVNKKLFLKYVLLTIAVGVAGFVACLLFSKFLLNLLYPNLVDQAIKYVPIATASAIINMIFSTINPFVLRFKNITWQIVINAIGVVVYFALSLGLYHIMGLIGFYLGILITNILKVVVSVIIFLFNKQEKHPLEKIEV